MRRLVVCLAFAAVMAIPFAALAQSTNASLTGRVLDPTGAVVPGVQVKVTSYDKGTSYTGETNSDGIYHISILPPGIYRIDVSKVGFRTTIKPDVVLNVQDVRVVNFALEVGSVQESITVSGGAPVVNTESAAVSTVVDRQFVENLPLNGRSFQSLFLLTPALVFTKASATEAGQFSVNGQRADSNYLTIDGVAANVGANPNFLPGQSLAGSIPALSASGGTNNLVSVDALQEFRVQTSSFAPEYGRTPGAQISVITKSGTNDFHGDLFEYFRNDVLDANDWFSNHNRSPKKALRQNDFGGVFGGPIVRNRTFFFFSYEGLRLRQPQFVLSSVPSIFARQNAPASLQPFLNAFPMPNGPATIGSNGLPTGFAPFNSGFSVPSSFDSASLRLDHAVKSNLGVFARYNYSPSSIVARGGSASINTKNPIEVVTQTFTAGTTYSAGSHITNDFRLNYSRNRSAQSSVQDTFGGAVVPDAAILFPSFPLLSGVQLSLNLVGGGVLIAGKSVNTVQRQINFVDSVSVTVGSHQAKFGIDYRRLSPVIDPRTYLQNVAFTSMGITAPGVAPPTGSVFSGKAASVSVLASAGPLFPIFTNVSAFAQDAWKIGSRLVITYGFRWDVNPAPTEANGNLPFTVTGIANPATATLAPAGTAPYATTHGNFAPRVGAAYRVFQDQGHQTILRGGFGLFYDLGNQQAANGYLSGFPFSAIKTLIGVAYPLTPAQAAPPLLDPAMPVTSMTVFDPNFQLPRTWQWNAAFEQELGANQTFSLSYVAAAGRRLIRQDTYSGTANGGNLNPAVFATTARVNVLRNTASSNYQSLQAQFKRRLARGLQGVASYTWSHSTDNESNDSDALNLVSSAINLNAERGPSDFDVRHSFSGAISYAIPYKDSSKFAGAFLKGWSLQSTAFARTAFPVNITYSTVTPLGLATLRPDLVPGVPLELTDPTVPQGRQINPAAFSRPIPARQGTLGRNAFRGFGDWQLDFAVHRQFPLRDRAQLQFRTEFFNILNHPNFADPIGFLLGGALFGHSIQTLAQGLGTGGAGGGFNPLYQIGGPRSIQLALKLIF